MVSAAIREAIRRAHGHAATAAAWSHDPAALELELERCRCELERADALARAAATDGRRLADVVDGPIEIVVAVAAEAGSPVTRLDLLDLTLRHGPVLDARRLLWWALLTRSALTSYAVGHELGIDPKTARLGARRMARMIADGNLHARRLARAYDSHWFSVSGGASDDGRTTGLPTRARRA